MTEQEREELIEKMVRALAQSHVNGLVYQDTARAALAVAEPVIREQCAKIAEKGNDETCWTASERAIATAIREGGENA